MDNLHLYNSLSGKKEKFEPLNPPFVGLYVCGPTVYSDVHLGNCRTFVHFDVIYRYLLYKGFKVRYVRNITDVGHLREGGEDRMLEKAKVEKIEPMEVAQKYTVGFHRMMDIFNNLAPSIEPIASGHIPEQIKMVDDIIKQGFGYVSNGSVYFDTKKYAKKHPYGKLSGRVIEELLAETREELKGASEKKNPSDFAIWMKAEPEHIMRWDSPWSVGFPGWHLECSAMSTKYLGEHFDIHGGGNDLKFPHHENEIAQNVGACGCSPANYWLHTNMLLMNGKKMSKTPDPSTGISNSITPHELFTGDNPNVTQGYSPMVVRFFMLQSHYSSTLDLSNDALLAAEKGYQRLMDANRSLQVLRQDSSSSNPSDEDQQINKLLDLALADMDDDFNTPKAMSRLFTLVNKINAFKHGQAKLGDIQEVTFARLQSLFKAIIEDVFGLKDEAQSTSNNSKALSGVMDLLLEIRQSARSNKDWATSDKIRDQLQAAGITIKDGKEGSSWVID